MTVRGPKFKVFGTSNFILRLMHDVILSSILRVALVARAVPAAPVHCIHTDSIIIKSDSIPG